MLQPFPVNRRPHTSALPCQSPTAYFSPSLSIADRMLQPFPVNRRPHASALPCQSPFHHCPIFNCLPTAARANAAMPHIQPRSNRLQKEAVLALEVRGSTRNKSRYERVQESHVLVLCCYASPQPTAIFARFFSKDDASFTSP